MDTVKKILASFVKVKKVKKAIAGAVVAFLVTNVGLDASVAESLGSSVALFISVYWPRNKE